MNQIAISKTRTFSRVEGNTWMPSQVDAILIRIRDCQQHVAFRRLGCRVQRLPDRCSVQEHVAFRRETFSETTHTHPHTHTHTQHTHTHTHTRTKRN